MKHVLSILFALVSLVAVPQEATVKSVVADPLNISASKYPMTDLNGRTAPLVIVRVLADNVEFKGSVLDGGVQKKTGEYWVYMGAGAKMLHIHSDRFLPVEISFPDYGIPRLEPSTTYIVTLTLPQADQTPSRPQAPDNFSKSPVDLALCAKDSKGRTVYITAEQWQSLSESQKSSFKPYGVYLEEGKFIVELRDKERGSLMHWDTALIYNLPTRAQAVIIGENKDVLNNALRVFGGTLMDKWYWTKTEYERDSSCAWYVPMTSGRVTFQNKTYPARVRAVAPVPGSRTR